MGVHLPGFRVGLFPDWRLIPAAERSGCPEWKRWDITYKEGKDRFSFGVGIEAAHSNLCNAIDRAQTLAAQEGWGRYVQRFDHSLQTLLGNREFTDYGGNILDGRVYTYQARSLLEGAASSWVFGGMGTWDDLMPSRSEARREYEECSDLLMTAIDIAVIAAVNEGRLPLGSMRTKGAEDSGLL
jgi:hypothetical protein